MNFRQREPFQRPPKPPPDYLRRDLPPLKPRRHKRRTGCLTVVSLALLAGSLVDAVIGPVALATVGLALGAAVLAFVA